VQRQADKSITVRAAREEDLGAALGLIEEGRRRNQWLEPIPELLTSAIRGTAGSTWACVAVSDIACVGVGIYGIVAGTVGTGVVQVVVNATNAHSDSVALAIVGYMLDLLRQHGARMVTAELPEHSSVDNYRSVLQASGFVQEGRVENYYADGVSLLHYRFDFD
jgi:hypothetical protein